MRKNLLSLAALMLLASGLTSCVYDKDELPVNGKDGSLTITIKSDDIVQTRAATTITTDPGTSKENQISDVILGLFKSDGTKVSITEPNLTESATQIAGTTFEGYKVAVAANIPTGDAKTALLAASDYDDFVGKSMGITEALNAKVLNDGTDMAIPMFGTADVTAKGDDFAAVVNVKHVVAKVTLNSLSVDFSGTGTPNAAFTPRQVFLINVPDVANLNTETFATKAAMYEGDNVITYEGISSGADHYYDDAATDKKYADCLGTGILSGTPKMVTATATSLWLNSANTAAQSYYFYTMPNQLETDDDRTYLVISGYYDSTGGEATEEVYYAAKLNNIKNGAIDETDAKLYANKNYKVNVVIKGKGAADAYASIDAQSVLKVAVSVTNFSDNGENAIFGNGTVNNKYDAIADVVRVGDVLFSDGTWCSPGLIEQHKTAERSPIGIVYSTKLSDADKATYKHGYALALKNASEGATWGPTDALVLQNQLTWTSDAYSVVEPLLTEINVDGNSGLTNYTYVKNNADNLSDYPAFDAVASYGVDVSGFANSGWFLPSIGDLHTMVKNLAGSSIGDPFEGDWKNTDAARGADGYRWGIYYKSPAAQNSRDAINAKLSVVGDGNYDAFIGGSDTNVSGVYWSSSEWSEGYAFDVNFFNNGNLHFHRYSSKGTSYRVRAVLAF